ncbi:MAG: orotidine-5'-phosphate decarboxylase [Defluviitaleaceae bacterium]|nr:orotidine-5'-phosphate decarboxylase [Defluviitaleaceae bacterium]
MIIDKLIDLILERQNPTVMGLDPRMEYVPADIVKDAMDRYGQTAIAVKYALLAYNKGIIDAICDIVPAVKPQMAFYEQFGAEGVDAYIQTVAYAKEKGLVVIGDVKRSDIASTAEAYSDGHIGRVDVLGVEQSFYQTDFITVNPYLGSDSVEPFLKNCEKYNTGLFLLVKTSNKGSGDFQDLLVDGRHIYEIVGKRVAEWGAGLVGKHGYSSIGAVVGATHPSVAAKLRKQLPNTFFLVPGYGAQGGSAADIAASFDKNGLGAIVNNSRGIIAAYKTEKYAGMNYAEAARAAALAMKDELMACRQ